MTVTATLRARWHPNGRRAQERHRLQTRDVLIQLITERGDGLGAHAMSVADLAAATAEHLGLSQAGIGRTRLAAELHDIGKTAIPESILSKPGPLDEEEWEIVRQHPVIGERIVREAPALEQIAPLVRSSHERHDGRGYPDGLLANEIPIESRIVAVVDALDAMTAERPYQPARTCAESLAELRRCSGTQFDPLVVEACRRVAESRAKAFVSPSDE